VSSNKTKNEKRKT